MGDQSTLIYSQPDGRAEGRRRRRRQRWDGERERGRDGRSWKVGEMSHSDNSDSFAEPAKVTTQFWWKYSFTHFTLPFIQYISLKKAQKELETWLSLKRLDIGFSTVLHNIEVSTSQDFRVWWRVIGIIANCSPPPDARRAQGAMQALFWKNQRTFCNHLQHSGMQDA